LNNGIFFIVFGKIFLSIVAWFIKNCQILVIHLELNVDSLFDLSIRFLQIIGLHNSNLIGTLNGSCPLILHLLVNFPEHYFYFFLWKRRIGVSTNHIVSGLDVTYVESGECYFPLLIGNILHFMRWSHCTYSQSGL
jgi:hypothetical protein